MREFSVHLILFCIISSLFYIQAMGHNFLKLLSGIFPCGQSVANFTVLLGDILVYVVNII